jgi:hypothetical protein
MRYLNAERAGRDVHLSSSAPASVFERTTQSGSGSKEVGSPHFLGAAPRAKKSGGDVIYSSLPAIWELA